MNTTKKNCKKIFVTGTGTDIGKTFVTALIVKKLTETGKQVAYYKAAMSGNDRREDGSLIPGDADYVKSISGIGQSLEEMCPYIYENAYSPHLASRVEGNPVRLEKVEEEFNKLTEKYDFITMEGSGGILCPIGYDEEKIYLEDIIKKLDLSCVLIADAGLGTINNVVLTAEYMKARNIKLKGIIFNHYTKGDIIQEDNVKMCEELTGVKVIAFVSEKDKELTIPLERLVDLYE